MKQVLTMTMNPCIDRTIYFSQFKAGATNYVDNIMEEAAGKGINVAVGLAHIHVPVKALGFVYEENAKCLFEKLEKEQVSYDFVKLPGRMRVNQKLFDTSTREMTECNERGCPVNQEEVERLLELLKKELQQAAILVLSGSVPPGVDADIYARMICLAKKAGVLTVLDASGSLLEEGIKEQPYLIKPNRDEFVGTFLGTKQEDWDAEKRDASGIKTNLSEIEKIAEKAAELVAGGVEHICISLGKDGMMLVNADGVYNYPAIKPDVKSLQGAGDAMVAGLCKAIYEKEEKKMAEYALKMAASTISLEGSRMGSL